MEKSKVNYFNLIVQLAPQVFRLVYKIVQAQRSGGIDKEEAQEIAGEVLTVLIFTLESFDFELELPEELAELDEESVSEEEPIPTPSKKSRRS
tara:strand:+ start:430 stop:708 length:279 start_codon:yes stop_codon:yes gene_type:complete